MSEVVTGDAVVVEVRVAQMPSRALALFIDMAVQFTVLVASYVVLQAFSVISDAAMFAAVSIVLSVLVLVGYPVIFETVSRGRSLGKLAMGLRVVSDDGGPERFRQALFRGLAGVLEFWMFSGAPALISSLISQRGKRLGDVFAGTIVISERGPRDTGQAIVMPPPLAAWASRLELSRLPEEVAGAARQYLVRWHDLAPHVQHEMGVRIATQVAAFVSPPAPPGVPAHAYLSAVLAERRRRDHERLVRRMAGHAPQTGPGAAPFPPQGPAAAPYTPQGPSPAPFHPQGSAPTSFPPQGPAAAPFHRPGAPAPAQEPPRPSSGGFAPPA